MAVSVTISNFTPKPHTPFQWHSVSTAEFERKRAMLREALGRMYQVGAGLGAALAWHPSRPPSHPTAASKPACLPARTRQWRVLAATQTAGLPPRTSTLSSLTRT
jgi:hypothetical protein